MRLQWFCAVLLAALAGNPPQAVAGEVVLVIIEDFKFIPQQLQVKVGQTVRWENREKRQYHSVWFEQLGAEESDYLFPEESYERSFDTPGVFPYRCGPHPKMLGSITVVE